MSEEIQILKNLFNNNKKEILISLAFIILILTNIFFGILYFSELKECNTTKNQLQSQKINEKVVSFAQLFVAKVLKAKSEVSFDERLKLENAVRGLDDKDILDQWEKFVSSNTELEAQQNVKDLLEILVNKISISSK